MRCLAFRKRLKIVKNEKEDFYGIRFTIRTLYCKHRNCVLE